MENSIEIHTISDLGDNGMSLGLYCLSCERWKEIIPNEWLSSGKPNFDYVDQKFKCEDCGKPLEKQVRWRPIKEQVRFRGLSPTEERMYGDKE